MAIAEDLLTLADRLAHPAPGEPEQASLRRAISTAYYALFHLLVQEAAQIWLHSTSAHFALERRFEHRVMKDVSRAVAQGTWKGWTTPAIPVPGELRSVAGTFVDLQDARHQADYDNSALWGYSDVHAVIVDAHVAFDNWAKIRTHPAANEYLLSLLIGNKRE
jgi:uncharacterized protein (UPF0332 family)